MGKRHALTEEDLDDDHVVILGRFAPVDNPDNAQEPEGSATDSRQPRKEDKKT